MSFRCRFCVDIEKFGDSISKMFKKQPNVSNLWSHEAMKGIKGPFYGGHLTQIQPLGLNWVKLESSELLYWVTTAICGQIVTQSQCMSHFSRA